MTGPSPNLNRYLDAFLFIKKKLCRRRDPLQNQVLILPKLILSSGKWKLASCIQDQDAAGLTQLSSTVEDVFSSGHLPRAAETLANMRHCLTAVGEVNVAQEMRGILTRIGRFKSLEVHYTKVHLKSINKFWDDFDLRQQSNNLAYEKSEAEKVPSSQDSQSNLSTVSLSSWLPNFYDECFFILDKNGSGNIPINQKDFEVFAP